MYLPRPAALVVACLATLLPTPAPAQDPTYEQLTEAVRSYATTVTDKRTRVAGAYTAALANFETTVVSASAQEAEADVLGAAFKWGLKTARDQVAGRLPQAKAAGLVLSFYDAVNTEIDRAASAAAGKQAADWIVTMRSGVTNRLNEEPTAEELRATLQAEFDTGESSWTYDDLKAELAAVSAMKIPQVESIEMAMYEAFVNAQFDNDCMSTHGNIRVELHSDGTLDSATLQSGVSQRIATGINRTMGAAGRQGVFGLGIVTTACIDGSCMCFEGNNSIRMDTDDAAARAVLTNPSTWTRISTLR